MQERTASQQRTVKAVPVYLQVADIVLERVALGVYQGMLPNEGDLAREFRVSPGSMRKALDLLEAQGVLLRKQGHGTFVVQHGSWEDLGDDAQAFLLMAGSLGPSRNQPRLMLKGPRASLGADELRKLGAGVLEIAAWLERRERLKGGVHGNGVRAAE
jgi:DNA-binding transcriptional MocR family regulator